MNNQLSAADIAYLRIRDLIMERHFASGERLKEEELAELVGASRTPVREALARLQNAGLITIHKNRGAVVSEHGEESAREIFELRTMVEPYVARHAAIRRDDDVVLALSRLAEEMEMLERGDSDSVARMAQLNSQFHELVARAAGLPRTFEIVNGLVSTMLVLRTFASYDHGAWDRSLRHHREILDAIRLQDPDWAETAMRTHIRAGASEYFRGKRSTRASTDGFGGS